MIENSLSDSSIVKVLSLHGNEEGKRHICDTCTVCRECEGHGCYPGYVKKLCPSCLGARSRGRDFCKYCERSGVDPLVPQQGCPKCSCETCRCPKCLGTGRPQMGVSWEVLFTSGVTGHFCTRHYHALDWLCDVCGRLNSIITSRCACRNVKPSECRKCHKTYLEGGLYKLVDAACVLCDGLGINLSMARSHIDRCKTCRELEKADPELFKKEHLDIVRDDSEEQFPCGADKYCCDECTRRTLEVQNNQLVSCDNTPTGVRRRSKSARWLIQSIDLQDIDGHYHDSLRPYIGQYICFRCACPDMQVVREFAEKIDPGTGAEQERYCLICQKEGIRLKLTRYNPSGILCFRHRGFCTCGHPKDVHTRVIKPENPNRKKRQLGCEQCALREKERQCERFVSGYRMCVVCGRELQFTEGPYCSAHTTCLAPGCDDRPVEGEVMCKKHPHIKGFGAFLDRGGFSKRRSHKAASGFTSFSTSKAVSPAGMMAKWETFERRQSIVQRKLTRAYDVAEENARKLELNKISFTDVNRMEAGSEKDLELRVLENERGRHQKKLDEANEVIAKYQSLHNLFTLAFERIRETEEGYVADIPTTELTPEEANKRIAEQKERLKPKSVGRQTQCMVCNKIYTDAKELEWVVGLFPGNRETPRGKQPIRYLACRPCRGLKGKKAKLFNPNEKEVAVIQRQRLIEKAFGRL